MDNTYVRKASEQLTQLHLIYKVQKIYMTKSFFSTKPYNIVPALVYSNADTDKVKILNENRGKSGAASPIVEPINLIANPM